MLCVLENSVLLNAIIDCFESVIGMVLALESILKNSRKLPADFASGISATLSFLIVAHFLKERMEISATPYFK